MNHESMLDPVAVVVTMWLAHVPVRIVYKSEFDKILPATWLFSRAGGFPVARGTADMKVVRRAKAMLARGECVLIYPEGTRVRDDADQQAHGGYAIMAQLAHAPVQPVAIIGARPPALPPPGLHAGRGARRVVRAPARLAQGAAGRDGARRHGARLRAARRAARRAPGGGVIVAEIRVASEAGACYGVERALQMVEAAADERAGAVRTLGPLIHNPRVVAGLAERGVDAVGSPEEAAGGTLLLRTHGTVPEEEERARRLCARVLDATCPFVKKVHQAAERLSREGYQVVVVGEAGHPEVEATLPHAPGAVVVGSAEEAAALPHARKVGVVVQTTAPPGPFSPR